MVTYLPGSENSTRSPKANETGVTELTPGENNEKLTRINIINIIKAEFLLPGVPIYLTTRFVYRLQEFVKHWYMGGFVAISRQAISLLEQLDRTFALQVTLRYIFEPLYQDRTVLGHILGFIFRSVRILLALVIYVIVLAIFIIIYFAWSMLLPYTLYRTAAAFNLINTISLWNL